MALNKRIFQLGWVSFFADIASEMAYPILPLFMVALGAPATGLGLVEGVAEAIVSFMKGLSGVQTDRLGRRLPFIRWGYGLSALGKPLIALATIWPLVVLARGLDRVGKGLRTTPRDALISESADADKRGAAFGFHRAMDTAGALVGVVVTLLLLKVLPEATGGDVRTYQLIFALAVIPGIFSVWVTLRVKEEPVKPNLGSKWSRSELSKMPRAYWVVLAVSLVFGLANTSDTFLLLRAKQSGFSDFETILAYALYNVAYTALAFPFGKLSDRIGRIPVIAAGWIVYGIVYFGFGQGMSSAWLLFLGYGIYQGLAQGATKALIADHSPAESKGAAMGFFYMVAGGATLVGNIVAGLVWDRVSPALMFNICGGLALVAASLLLGTRKLSRVAG